MDIKILVAAHKPYWMPADDVYMPIHVGAAGKQVIDTDWQRDDDGDNISLLNSYYCELTALYWAWKNLACDYIGLCHYRRYFGRKILRGSIDQKCAAIYGRADYEKMLSQADVLLPKKRNYYIETVYSQYAHAHRASDLDTLEQILTEKYPVYLPAWKKVMDSRRLHILNMFVMDKKHFDAYCTWLFDIIFTFAEQFDRNDPYLSRLFGYIAERLLNVWLMQQNLHEVEADVVMLEPVNWLKKGGAFLKRKFFGYSK